jgi:hypothetical protein
MPMVDFLDEIIDHRVVNACIYQDYMDFKFFSEYNVDINNSFTLLNLNIRSFNKNFDELTVILSHYNHKFDIIVLTETWMDESCANVSMDG